MMPIDTKEKPIAFSSEMVRAILAGQKKQTRRVLKNKMGDPIDKDLGDIKLKEHNEKIGVEIDGVFYKSPYGNPGDRLWVREAWATVPRTAFRLSPGVQQTLKPECDHDSAVYKAGWDRSAGWKWKPSIHMPRWASRIDLFIKQIRVERLQTINDIDAWREGVEYIGDGYKHYQNPAYNGGRGIEPIHSFRTLWDSINGGTRFEWDTNPLVWVVDFERIWGAA